MCLAVMRGLAFISWRIASCLALIESPKCSPKLRISEVLSEVGFDDRGRETDLDLRVGGREHGRQSAFRQLVVDAGQAFLGDEGRQAVRRP
jgi:hypothetical protein